jgi:hypothetical protein
VAVAVAFPLAIATATVVGTATATVAAAESADVAQASADRAAKRLRLLETQTATAVRSYDQGLRTYAQAVTVGVSADRTALMAERTSAVARTAAARRVTAAYSTGGQLSMWAAVIDADSPTDLLRRISYVRAVVVSSARTAGVDASHAGAARQRADALLTNADRVGADAAEVTRRYLAITGLLAEQRRVLAELTGKARRLRGAEEAAARLAAAEQSVNAVSAARLAQVRAGVIPADYLTLYHSAAVSCPGLSWRTLAAIGQVESGHGTNPGVSSAGAVGPMQFLPTTFAAFAVDGNRDGRAEISDPADAIFTAAAYLCHNGAGAPDPSGQRLYQAIYRYNHADWYVQLVLRIAEQLTVRYPV